MLKRYGLVVFLFCFSIIVGIAIAMLETAAVFFFSTGILVLSGLVTALFAAVIVLWLTLKKKNYTRDPERSVRHQGTAFGTWFAVHNLFWAFVASLAIWGLFRLFGFKPWVIVFSAGALACACFALIGTFLTRKREMLGLCWQSRIPDGLGNFWARAGASLILRERYELAAEHDQKQHIPVLWSISRIFNRSATGGADRAIDLLEPRREFLSNQLKKEWRHRVKVLLVLFCITAFLAALPGFLGFAANHWDQVPASWPSDKMKSPQSQQSQQMASNSKPGENNQKGDSSGDANNQNNQGKQSPSDSKNSETGEKGQTSSDSGQSQSKQGQETQDSKNQSSGQGQPGKGDSNQDQKGKQNQEAGDSGQDKSKQAGSQQEGSQQDQKEKGDQKGKAGDSKEKGESGKEKGQGQDSKESQTTETGESCESGGSGAGQQDKPGQEQGQGQGQGQGQEQGQQQGQGDQQGQTQGKGGSEGSDQDKKEGNKESTQSEESQQGQPASQGKGAGEGQGLGDPNHTPEMSSEPQPLPQIPSRATDMVTLELPTLSDQKNKGKGNETPQQKTTPQQELSPKAQAPTTRYETGKQERSAAKPEQYLPNWILNLLNKKIRNSKHEIRNKSK